MRTWIKVLIGSSINFLILLILLVLTLILEFTWIIFILVGSLSLVIWLPILSVITYNKIFRKKPETLKVNLEDVEIMAKYMESHDEENPDNFIIQERKLYKVGEAGSERTHVGVLIGKGTELKQKRVVIVNLQNPKESTRLIDPSDDEVERMVIKISESQPEQEVTETIPGGVDVFGRPTSPKIITRKVSRAEAKDIKEKEDAEEKLSF